MSPSRERRVDAARVPLGEGCDLPGHIAGLLALQVETRGEALALITPDGRWTYRQWFEQAQRVAAALESDGVGPGDTVALLCPNRLEWLAVAVGCTAVGARLAAFNTWVKAQELDHLLRVAAPKVMVTVDRWARQDFLEEIRQLLPEICAGAGGTPAHPAHLRRLVVIGDDVPGGATPWEDWRSSHGRRSDPVGSPDDVAFVLFTSGSTARPKGVTLGHRDLIANGFHIGERQGLGPDDRLLLVSPLFWALGSANALMAALTHGTCLVALPRFEPEETLSVIETEGCTAIYTLSVITHGLLDHAQFSPGRVATLRRGLTFGSPAEMRLAMEGLGVDLICNIYGSTEVYGNCAVSPWDAPPDRRMAACGPPLPGVEICITDPDTGEPLGPGCVGEIWVRGRVTPGYLAADGTLQDVRDPEGWFHSGDLGHLDADGWLAFVSRESEMIKSSGINVSPTEVEAVLAGHDAIAAVAVTGVDHPVRGQDVVAFVRLRPGATLDPNELREWARQRAASYKVPSRIFIVEEFPVTGTGKLSRRDLVALEEARRDR